MTLDMVNKKGRHLAEDNCRVPKMAQQIQSQLRNLEESYLNLQSTAEQIKVSWFFLYALYILIIITLNLENAIELQIKYKFIYCKICNQIVFLQKFFNFIIDEK